MRDLLMRSAADVAPGLLGSTVISTVGGERVAVRIVETEAYGGSDDPASHAYRGMTKRNASMFARPGIAYLYFTYGMHWCLNVTVGQEGRAGAVLLRGGEVVEGQNLAAERRRARSGRPVPPRDLARGPARLCQALGLDGSLDGVDLLDASGRLWLEATSASKLGFVTGPRVGVTRGADRPWRFWLPDSPSVSAYRGTSPAKRRQR